MIPVSSEAKHPSGEIGLHLTKKSKAQCWQTMTVKNASCFSHFHEMDAAVNLARMPFSVNENLPENIKPQVNFSNCWEF
jgi:hypothetical protein